MPHLHLQTLPAFKVEEIADVLRTRMRNRTLSGRRYCNCRAAAEWLERLVAGVPAIANVELKAPGPTFFALKRACAEEGEYDLADAIIRGLDFPVLV